MLHVTCYMRDATCEMLHVTCLFSRPEFHSKPTFDNLQYNVGKCQIVAAGPTEDRRRTDTNLSPEGHRWPGGRKRRRPSIDYGSVGRRKEQWAALTVGPRAMCYLGTVSVSWRKSLTVGGGGGEVDVGYTVNVSWRK